MRQVGSEYVADVAIGQGSTGQVWRGTVVATGQPVAIKLLDPRLARDPETVARFVRERSILTGIRSAHLVGVHDLVAERDTLAIVMDLVPGVDLRHHLRQVGSLAPGLATELIGQVLGALSVVHRAGIVHRDVKPENVLLDLTEAERPRALLTDFGIARIVGDGRPGGLAGTLRYMAPEVARSGDASPASDLYSTGVVLYELLGGRPPFESGEPFGLLRAHELEPAAPIPGLPAGLQSVLDQLLAKRPADRPASATAARQLLAGAAVEVRGMTALPLLGDTDRYHGPTIPPGFEETIADLPPADFHAAVPAGAHPPQRWFATDPGRAAEPSVVPAGRPGAAPRPARPEGSPTVLLSNSAAGGPTAGAPRPGSENAESGVAALGTLLVNGHEPGAVPTPRDGDGGGAVGAAFYGGPGDEPPHGRRGLIGLGVLAVLAIALILGLIAFWNSGSGTPAAAPSPSLVLNEPSAVAPVVPAVTATAAPTPSATPTPAATKKPKPKPKVPDVIGLMRAGGIAKLEAAGLTRVSVIQGCFAGHRAGRIVAQAPSPGSTVSGKQASVEVQNAGCVTVPSVVGDNLTQAVLRLRQAGFTNVRTNGGGGGGFGNAMRRVASQTPKGGSSALTGHAIVLTLANGRNG